MSLKAKLEAVIYAAEEPVTLTQLAQLFAAEAFEYKAEQDATASAAAAEASAEADPSAESLPHLAEGLEYLGLEESPANDPGPEPEVPVESIPQAAAESSAEISPEEEEPQAVASPAEDGSAAPAALDAETEARRLARQRDREVKAILRQILDELIASYTADERGIEIREIAGGYRLATKPECHDAVRLFIKSLKPAMKLSLPALETLAVIAYKQPVTAPEVNEIRGVDSSGVFGSLLSRKLITTAGRKQVIGRPILYKTTKEFLLRFGLKDVSELPSMEEFEKIAAIELTESGTEPDNVGGPASGTGPELDENASEEEAALDETATSQPQSATSAEPALAASETTPTDVQAEGLTAERVAPETETPPHD
jgi:segregation and condensation protein B